jgi:ribonuclease HI
METIIYTDASGSGKQGRYWIGYVALEDGVEKDRVVHVRDGVSSSEAEREAIRLAKEKYPDAKIFSDDQSAAAATGATWISRKQNGEAHKLVSEFRKRGSPPKRVLKAVKPESPTVREDYAVAYDGLRLVTKSPAIKPPKPTIAKNTEPPTREEYDFLVLRVKQLEEIVQRLRNVLA